MTMLLGIFKLTTSRNSRLVLDRSALFNPCLGWQISFVYMETKLLDLWENHVYLLGIGQSYRRGARGPVQPMARA